MINKATLDLTEPRRVSFRVVGVYDLDVCVNRNDVREFMFDIDSARSEWITSEGIIRTQIPLLPMHSS